MNLFLKPDECKFLAMAVVDTHELIEKNAKDPSLPWTPEARRYHREMMEAATSLIAKLKKLGLDMRPLDPYKPGDEKEFLTKES